MPKKKAKLPLYITHPDLAIEANGWESKSVVAGSPKKMAWICKFGHTWEAPIRERANRNLGCPYCSGNRVFQGFNDLRTTHPDLAQEAFGWDPTMFSRGSKKKVEWKCGSNHIWQSVIASRAIGKNGCPFCGRKKVLKNFNDLKTTHPSIASEADGWDPSEVLSGNSKKLKWKCSSGHNWMASPISRTNMKTGCSVCSGRQIQIGINDLATTHPELIVQISKGDPTKYSAGSHKKFEWECDSGHIYTAQIKSRALNGTGCGVCANNRSIRYSVPLSISHPFIAKEAYGWDPSKIKAGSSRKLSWICPKKHIYTAVPGWRTRDKGASGCPICSGKQILIGFNDLGTLKPEISKEAFGWNPEDFGIGSHKKVKWKCKQGHIYESQIKSRALNNSGCAVCVNQKLLTGYNDLKTRFPILAREAYGWDPSKILAGSAAKKKWQCQYGHIWTAKLNNRTSSAQSGCPSCAKFGFNPNESGFLYFIGNIDLNMYQIGITNFPKDRLLAHSKSGWELIEIRGPMDGHLTQQWETAILRMLKAKGADLSNEKIAGKFDGYSEAWSKSTFPVKSIKELMRLTEKFEESK